MQDFESTLSDTVSSQIGRIVAFAVTPILLPVVGAAAVWLQQKLGIHMDPAVATGYVVAVVTGVALAVYKWLHNRGAYERTAVEVTKLYDAGREYADAAVLQEQAKADAPPRPRKL